ncbi:MAG: phosphoribosyl transferase [Spartobacteria bacterium AMD-G4]|jgi:putative phosphoribosyl transferase|nr:MAG: phosphoribosyl transferase [Spartobacteria bacterium AMD-G4]
MSARFQNREEAGRILAAKLMLYANRPDTLILALPRGGVPIGYEIARALNLPLDVIIVRKLGVPGHEELAMGAIASGGVRVLNRSVIESLRIPPDSLEAVEKREALELMRREATYRGNRQPASVKGKTVILVDDGVATGSTMRVAISALREQHAGRIIVATPVAPPTVRWEMEALVEDFVALVMPEDFFGVGQWYGDFTQVSDDTVYELLRKGAKLQPTEVA